MDLIGKALANISDWGLRLFTPTVSEKSSVDRIHYDAEVVTQTSGDYKIQDVYPRTMQNQVDAQIAARVFVSSPFVNAAVRKLADAVVSTPLKVYFTNRAGDKRVVTTGQPYTMLNNVNPHQTLADLMADTISWYLLYGNAFWVILPSDPDFKSTSDLSIYALNPQFTTVVPNRTSGVDGYIYRIRGQVIEYPAKSVIHFRNFNPIDHYFGFSNLNALTYDLQVERFAKRQIANYFNNAVVTNGVITWEGVDGNSEEVKKLKKELFYQHAGARNAHRMLILTGQAKYMPIPQDSGFSHAVPVLDNSLQTHSMVMGVPVPLLTGNTQNKTLIEFESFMWKETIIPLCTRIEQMLTKRLATPLNTQSGGRWSIEFDYKNIEALQLQDLNRKRGDVADMITGVLSANEVRANRDLTPWTGESAEFGDMARPVFDAKMAAKAAAAKVSPSLGLPGSEGSPRNQSSEGEAQMVDTSGQKNLQQEFLRKFVNGDPIEEPDMAMTLQEMGSLVDIFTS